MIFVIPGEPVPKGRPRFTKSGHVYTPKRTKDYEDYIQYLYKGKELQGEIEAEIKVYLQIPKSASKTRKDKLLTERPTKKPDLDNLAKTILDALNGLAYKDDSQVVSLLIEKYWSDNPRVEVKLKEI